MKKKNILITSLFFSGFSNNCVFIGQGSKLLQTGTDILPWTQANILHLTKDTKIFNLCLDYKLVVTIITLVTSDLIKTPFPKQLNLRS